MLEPLIAEFGVKGHRLERHDEDKRLARNQSGRGVVNGVARRLAARENRARIEHEWFHEFDRNDLRRGARVIRSPARCEAWLGELAFGDADAEHVWPLLQIVPA